MDTLSDLLQTDTTLWAGGVIGIVVGLLVGLLLGLLAGVRRRRRSGDGEPHRNHRRQRPDVTAPVVRFVGTADTAHNALLSVDQKELADTDLDAALNAENPGMRRIAESIVALADIHNELRIRAPKKVLDAAESVFTHVTYSAMDGVTDPDVFSSTYRSRKTDLIDAARAEADI